MLSFVQSWFQPAANPIGIDFGSDGLRMAQVEMRETGEPRLVAAARADVPAHLRNDPLGKIAYFADTARDLISDGNFRGRKVVLSLPASVMTIQHMRMAKMDDTALKAALPWECRGKLPYDPSHALLRHMVAGEVHADGEQKLEIVLMAAQREWVNQYLAAAAKARLDVVGMNVEAKALIDCFSHVYRRKADLQSTTLYVDIGCTATRAVVTYGGQILFARSIPIGGDHFTRAAAQALGCSAEDAEILRIKLCHQQAESDLARTNGVTTVPGESRSTPADEQPHTPGVGPSDSGRSAHEAAGSTGAGVSDAHSELINAEETRRAALVDHAYGEPLQRLVGEMSLCRRYHEATFPTRPIDRLIFVGGEARHRSLCQRIAREMDLAAQVGDPMARMARDTTVGIESGIDRRLPQPDWAVALGLSLGSQAAVEVTPAAAAK